MATHCPKCHFDNTADSKFCKECGTQLVQSGGSQVSITKTLETIEDLGKGELFAGRFEQIEELGSGGMGKVFRAFDKKIGEEVALKLLHPEIALEERTVDRFRNEIKLARRITHKNVCRLHELHEEGKTLFITMEYVSGQDLKGLIREAGALATGKAISIAKQVAEGLAEAHDLGVVHRDLKPQNIMVDKEGLAKIMDFGIARSLRTAGMTAEGMIIGTPEYMAPEQVEGQEADQRTDIYALGAILFEMATGRVPFEGDSPLSVAYKHKNETPLPPRELNSQIPEPFNQLILRCLEKEKESRYQTADELLADLVRIEDGLPISERVVLKARPTIRISREKPRGLKRFRAPAIIALALVVAAVVIFRIIFYKPSPPPAPKVPNSVAIISFTNLTGEKDLDRWTRGVPELLITNLENTGNFRVTTWERMRDILKQMGKKDVDQIDSDLGFELCRRAGIESLVTGTMTKAGDIFALDVRVLDIETKELRKSAASKGEGEESILNTQADELSRAIAEGLGTAREKIEQTPFQVAEMTTASPEAFGLYLIGKERNDNLDMEKAAEYLERAVKIDPGFAAAYHELGRAYDNSGRLDAARQAFSKALELSGRASEKDRSMIEASHAWLVERDLQKSAAILEEAANRYPDDKEIHLELGARYYYQKRYADAVKAFEESLRLDPDFGPALNFLGVACIELGDFERSVQAFKKYIALTPAEANPWDSLGLAYMRMGKVDEAIASFKEALKIQPDFFLSNIWISYLFAFKEDYAQALQSVERWQSLNLPPQRLVETWLFKGFYLYWQGRFSGSLEALRQAEDIINRTNDVEDIYKTMPFRIQFMIHYDRGEFGPARDSIRKFCDYFARKRPQSKAYWRVIEDFYLGLCDLREGRVDPAREKLEDMKSLLQDISERGKENAINKTHRLEAEVNLAEGAVEEAISYFERVTSSQGLGLNFDDIITGNWPESHDRLARAYEKKGDLDRAIAECEQLISPDPKKFDGWIPLIHPRYYYRLARLCEAKGLKDKARNYYRRFLDLWKDADPGIAEVDDAKACLAALK